MTNREMKSYQREDGVLFSKGDHVELIRNGSQWTITDIRGIDVRGLSCVIFYLEDSLGEKWASRPENVDKL